MKTAKPIVYIIILLCSLALGLAGGALLFYSMNFCYNAEISHFNYGAAPMIAFIAVSAAIPVLSAVTFFITNKHTVYNRKEGFSFVNTFFSILGACFSAFFAVTMLRLEFEAGKEIYSVLLIASSFLAALWFIIDGLGLVEKLSSLKFLAIGPAMMTLFLTVFIYFNTQYSMNSPLKGLCLIAVLSIMLYYAEYTGVVFGAQKIGKKYAAFAILATGIGGAVSLALLASSIYNTTGFNTTMLFSMLCVVLWLISLSSFASTLSHMEITAPDTVESKDEEEYEEESKKESEDEEPENTSKEENAEKTSTASETPKAFEKASEESEDDSDEYYGEDDEDEDIYIPPVTFDDSDDE